MFVCVCVCVFVFFVLFFRGGGVGGEGGGLGRGVKRIRICAFFLPFRGDPFIEETLNLLTKSVIIHLQNDCMY